MTKSRPNVNPDELLSRKEAAEALGIDRKTLDRYTEQGIIKCGVRRCNGRRVWKGSEIIKCWNFVY